ncbi:MAG: hypothetical protein R3C03_13415 [Pirellulaceae bacterium]
MKLNNEEYIEQSHLFRAMATRVEGGESSQERLKMVREEILTTTRLPLAIDYLSAELSHSGTMATAMKRMSHYFTPFQTFLIECAESEKSRFDINRAFVILDHEARFRTECTSLAAFFFFQFETLCRNRLNYASGLDAMSQDPIYDSVWQGWLKTIRHKIGIVELADLVYVHSDFYMIRSAAEGLQTETPDPILFGEKEGRIALANRRKEPMFFFAALQRQLKYPLIPKLEVKESITDQIPKLQRQLERMEVRIKLLEDENREKGIDLAQFYKKGDQSTPLQ